MLGSSRMGKWSLDDSSWAGMTICVDLRRRVGLLGILTGVVLLVACGPPAATYKPNSAAAPADHAATVYVAAGAVVALRASDGSSRWSYQTDGNPVPPALSDGVLYTAAESASGGDNVYALDAASHSLRWLRPLNHPVDVPITVSDGTIYIGLGMSSKYATSYGAECALRANDGIVRWCRQ